MLKKTPQTSNRRKFENATIFKVLQMFRLIPPFFLLFSHSCTGQPVTCCCSYRENTLHVLAQKRNGISSDQSRPIVQHMVCNGLTSIHRFADLLLPQHLFPHLCGVDVSGKLPPHSFASPSPTVPSPSCQHLRFCLPFLLIPSTSIIFTLFPIFTSSLMTCPYNSNLLSCTLLPLHLSL